MATELLKGPAPANARHALQRAIVGTDNREPVGAPHEPPWRAICRMTITPPFMSNVIGTGFFIAPQIVMTAAHCLDDNGQIGGKAERIELTAHIGEGTTETVTVDDPARFHTPFMWMGGSGPGHCDYGIIDLRGTGFSCSCTLPAAADFDSAGLLANVAGFPYDLHQGTRMVHHAASVLFASDLELQYETDTMAGQSGSPVWCYETADDDAPRLAGIHVAAGPRGSGMGFGRAQAASNHASVGADGVAYNVGVPISEEVMAFINEITA